DAPRQAQRLAHHAVHAQAHHQRGFEGFDVHVGGADARGFGDQAVDQADHRRVVLRVEQVGGGGDVAGQGVEVAGQVEVVAAGERGVGVELGQAAVEGGARQHFDLELDAE